MRKRVAISLACSTSCWAWPWMGTDERFSALSSMELLQGLLKEPDKAESPLQKAANVGVISPRGRLNGEPHHRCRSIPQTRTSRHIPAFTPSAGRIGERPGQGLDPRPDLVAYATVVTHRILIIARALG